MWGGTSRILQAIPCSSPRGNLPVWLQSGLALTDMFGMVFVLAFLLVEGISARTPQGDLARRMTCGLIAGLSLGAGPHITLLILAYRREGESKAKPKSETDCDRFRQSLASGHPVLATNPGLCGIAGSEVALFKRDGRIHDKHNRIVIFEFGRSAGTRVETAPNNH